MIKCLQARSSEVNDIGTVMYNWTINDLLLIGQKQDHLLLDHGWSWVTESKESKTADKEGLCTILLINIKILNYFSLKDNSKLFSKCDCINIAYIKEFQLSMILTIPNVVIFLKHCNSTGYKHITVCLYLWMYVFIYLIYKYVNLVGYSHWSFVWGSVCTVSVL